MTFYGVAVLKCRFVRNASVIHLQAACLLVLLAVSNRVIVMLPIL